MRFCLAHSVQRNADVEFIDEAADRFCLGEADAEPDEVNEVLAVDIPEVPGGFADAFEYDEYGHKGCNFEVREIPLFEVCEYARLPGIESAGESRKTIVSVEGKLFPVAGVFLEIDKAGKGRRESLARVEYVFP